MAEVSKLLATDSRDTVWPIFLVLMPIFMLDTIHN